MKPLQHSGGKGDMKKFIMAGTLLAFLSAATLPLTAAPDEPQPTTKTSKKKSSKKSKKEKHPSTDSSTPAK